MVLWQAKCFYEETVEFVWCVIGPFADLNFFSNKQEEKSSRNHLSVFNSSDDSLSTTGRIRQNPISHFLVISWCNRWLAGRRSVECMMHHKRNVR